MGVVRYLAVIVASGAIGLLLGRWLEETLGLPWWIRIPALVLVGAAIGKYIVWGKDREVLHKEQEASVLGAMVLGERTVAGIWRVSGRFFPTVVTTIARLEKRGTITSLSDGDSPLRRTYYLSGGNAVGWDQ